jgi:uncharacterized protein (DUF302 family)
MYIRKLVSAVLVAAAFGISPVQAQSVGSDGIVKVKIAYPMNETIARIKDDIAQKGIMFFSAIDQQDLAAKAGIELQPSTLLEFGNPPLGTQFVTAKGEAGLDWPVRLLVQQDEQGNVWAIYTDFDYIARRHGITNRDAQFRMASSVVTSITSTIKAN